MYVEKGGFGLLVCCGGGYVDVGVGVVLDKDLERLEWAIVGR